MRRYAEAQIDLAEARLLGRSSATGEAAPAGPGTSPGAARPLPIARDSLDRRRRPNGMTVVVIGLVLALAIVTLGKDLLLTANQIDNYLISL